MYDDDFHSKYTYNGDLGVKYYKDKSEFTFWSPLAKEVKVYLYKYNLTYPMVKGKSGEWMLSIEGDLNNFEYNYYVTIDNRTNEVVDPYAKAVSINGNRGVILNLENTNPTGWHKEKKPTLNKFVNSIIYEIHVRDFSIDSSSKVSKEHRGKFLGVSEDISISRLKELGITHVHLLPSFDYATIDESKTIEEQYNWGYDPKNYNVPEGSYSTDPSEPSCRIKEFKEMILKLHENGIRVIMDVVYNHTYESENSCFNLAMPKYYYRTDENNRFSNGSSCGNELASERSMVRKYIVDSVKYWAKEYHIDGFRFDLMGLIDIETMKKIRLVLNNIDKSILIYGEGWRGGKSPLADDLSANKVNTKKYGKMQIAVFSDEIRDGLKGNVFDVRKQGFANGGEGFEETIKAGVVAFTKHNEVDYSKVIYTASPWAVEPYQCIIYDSAHDNYTLFDRLQLSTNINEHLKENLLIKMNKFIASIILTCQGIIFLHGGEDFLRTKVKADGSLEENSYNSPDYVNKIDWNRKSKYKGVFNYYKGLIELRKNYEEFNLESSKLINEKIRFKRNLGTKVISYEINGKIKVVYNANKLPLKLKIDGRWSLVVNENRAGIKEIREVDNEYIEIGEISTYVFIKK